MMVHKSLLIPVTALVIGLLDTASCTHRRVAPPRQTIRICDDSGCADRPREYVSNDLTDPASTRDTPGIAALEALAASDPRAAYDLALRYFRGDEVRQDSYQAIKWMRDAAERGEFHAQKALGRLYLTGMGEMGADPGEAEKWLSITASRGDREAGSLLREATSARQSEQAQYRLYQRWRPTFYGDWNSSYPYLFGWRDGTWYPY